MSEEAPPPGLRAEHRLSAPGSAFAVWAESARVARAVEALPGELDLDRLIELLSRSPSARVPGKTKKLKGRLAGVIQYDLPDGNRAHDTVQGKHVIVRYVGRHPKRGG